MINLGLKEPQRWESSRWRLLTAPSYTADVKSHCGWVNDS